jgi:hypothetical protein
LQDRGSELNTRAPTWLAWSTCALSLVLTGFSGGLLILNLSDPDTSVFDYSVHTTAIAVAFSTVGAIIASHRPEHPVAWLFCAVGFLVSVDHFCAEYATFALLTQPGALPVGEATAWIRSWIWIVSGGLGVFLVLLFPDGQLPGARWRYLAWLNVFVVVLGSIAVAFSPGPVDGLDAAISNPLGIDSLGIAFGQRVIDVVEGFQMVVALTAAVSPFVRLRYAGLVEREQIKWFAYAATILIVGALLTSPVPKVWDAWWISWVGFLLYIGGIVGLPVAVGIAILRYRLYDIDIIINRTVVFSTLSVVLLVVFAATDELLEYLVLSFSGMEESPISTVVAAVTVAVVFEPLRRRIQAAVNRLLDQRIVGDETSESHR